MDFCSFKSGTWDHLPGIGAVLICDTHGEPGVGEVYDYGPGQAVGLCNPILDYVFKHDTFHRAYAPGGSVVVDETRCRCAQPVDACTERADVQAILAHLETERAAIRTSTPGGGAATDSQDRS